MTEPAKFERVFVGNDKFGAPKYETRQVQPERKVLKRFKVCSCGTKIALD